MCKNFKKAELEERMQRAGVPTSYMQHSKKSENSIVSDEVFENSSETITLLAHTICALELLLQKGSENNSCTLYLAGKTGKDGVQCTDFFFTTSKSSEMLKKLVEKAEEILKDPDGEVIYCFSNPNSDGKKKASFSYEEIAFLIEKAMSQGRNTYGLLVARNYEILVKYNYAESKFYKVRLQKTA